MSKSVIQVIAILRNSGHNEAAQVVLDMQAQIERMKARDHEDMWVSLRKMGPALNYIPKTFPPEE